MSWNTPASPLLWAFSHRLFVLPGALLLLLQVSVRMPPPPGSPPESVAVGMTEDDSPLDWEPRQGRGRRVSVTPVSPAQSQTEQGLRDHVWGEGLTLLALHCPAGWVLGMPRC